MDAPEAGAADSNLPRMKSGKVLFISRKWPPAVGGMESYSATLAAALSEHYELTSLVLPGKRDGKPPGLLAYALFVVRAMTHVLLHSKKYDHLILGDLILFPAGILSALVAPAQSRTVVLYGLDLVYQKRQGLLPFLYGGFLKGAVVAQKTFTHTVAISSHTRRLAEEASFREVSVILPSVPESGLPSCAPSAEDLPVVFNTTGRKILYFGRLVPRKGAEWFAREVLPSLPEDVSFFVVGAPTDISYYQQLIRHPGVTYLGRQDNQTLASLIAHADIVVMPNIPTPDVEDAEGFGLVAVEAASLGAVLVASRLQGITDAVIDGVTGILVEPGDANAWTEVVAHLLQEDGTKKEARRTIASTTCRAAYSARRLGREFFDLLN